MLKHLYSSLTAAVVLSSGLVAQAPLAPAPADGITMDMMPITPQQIAIFRDQAGQQLATEQDTLHKREHGQDNDKMKQGAISGVTGAATSAISRGRSGWWGWGNNNGANTAAATGATQRIERNSADVASTTGTSQQVGLDAYSQCVAGIKGPEYIHFRQTGRIEPFTGNATAGPSPAVAAAATIEPAPPLAAAAAKSPVMDEGDCKHFVLTAPGQTDAREVTRVGTSNSYIEEVTGDKYVVMPDGSVTRIPGRTGSSAKKVGLENSLITTNWTDVQELWRSPVCVQEPLLRAPTRIWSQAKTALDVQNESVIIPHRRGALGM